jgi:DNA modification methylase
VLENNSPYYEDDCGKLFLGNALELLKFIPDESIDCVITDPPYGIKYHSNHYVEKNPHSKIQNDEKLLFPIDELWRVIKPTGAIFSFYSHKIPIIDSRVKNVITWVKDNWSAGDLKADFGNQKELIAFIPKNKFVLHSKKRYSNVWYCERCKPILHPTQKPYELISKLIEVGSKGGDVILDPFMGSGVTAVVAQLMERNWLGFELEEEYCKTIVKELQTHKIKKFKKLYLGSY